MSNSKILEIYPRNNFYVTNNNMALYSSYIIIDETGKFENNYTIEAIAEYRNYESDLNLTKNIKCVLKYLKNDNDFEIIEVKPIDFAKIKARNMLLAMKFYFIFKLENFNIYKNEQKSFNLNKIMVAIISEKDFDKNIFNGLRKLQIIKIHDNKLGLYLKLSLESSVKFVSCSNNYSGSNEIDLIIKKVFLFVN